MYKLELGVECGEMGFLLSTGKVETDLLLKGTLVLILFFTPIDELVYLVQDLGEPDAEVQINSYIDV